MWQKGPKKFIRNLKSKYDKKYKCKKLRRIDYKSYLIDVPNY